jgi:hypothetical protein
MNTQYSQSDKKSMADNKTISQVSNEPYFRADDEDPHFKHQDSSPEFK